MPLRVFMVTGTPYGVAAATTAPRISPSRPRFHGSTPPPPLRVTLGTGHPKFRSMCATPYSAHRILAAFPTYTGSVPYSWTERTFSRSSKTSIFKVVSSRSTRPRDVIISQTKRPDLPCAAICSRHRRRYAALVMPAIGASTTGVSTVSGPRVSEAGRVAAGTASLSPDQRDADESEGCEAVHGRAAKPPHETEGRRVPVSRPGT